MIRVFAVHPFERALESSRSVLSEPMVIPPTVSRSRDNGAVFSGGDAAELAQSRSMLTNSGCIIEFRGLRNI
ncbi:hypothetical protein EK3BL_00920 [Bifidobacterium longum subsp. infantis EK3]|nr:hypothetical protein EK3BL_00920 [Bifidobacterium longum subsp. infantis EK3]